ncbi:MAG: SDR family NAD(P)-dependent oxidoreductase [Casimicrobium sp.]
MKKLRIMIVGAGDVAKRLAASSIASRVRWYALARSEESMARLRSLGILAVGGDLDQRKSLSRAAALARAAHATIYLAPPPNIGNDDPRIKLWLAESSQKVARTLRGSKALAHRRAVRKPTRLRTLRSTYISTTGVYGDRAGDWVSETSALRTTSARARRRVAAESRLRASRRARMSILRAPGIYAESRLPIERLRERVPALIANEDVFTNHIHADDLAYSAWIALFRGRANRAINVVDDASMKMGEYFDAVADALALPRAPRMARGDLAKHVTPMMLSFMSESRRIRNDRMKRELRIRLRYPTPQAMLSRMKPAVALQRTLL